MIPQRKIYPNIPPEFPGVPLESDYHLPIPAEEEEIIDENAVPEAAAANAELTDDDLQDVHGHPVTFPCQILMELALIVMTRRMITMTIVMPSHKCPSLPFQLRGLFHQQYQEIYPLIIL